MQMKFLRGLFVNSDATKTRSESTSAIKKKEDQKPEKMAFGVDHATLGRLQLQGLGRL
jgi:hypothetical protein